MRDASSLCQFCCSILMKEENVSQLMKPMKEEHMHHPQPPIFWGELNISRNFDDIFAASQSSCPLCSVLEEYIRESSVEGNDDTNLEGKQVKIRLQGRASFSSNPKEDFEGISLSWCIPTRSEKWEDLDFIVSAEAGKYAALSYCWGMAVQPLVTIGATISTLMQSVPMDDLPQTLKDAITVARKLGICYLWADVLCIIQDDSADKTEQISKIPSIFTNSHVTICAASAVSCTSGFLNRSPDDFEPFELPFRCPGSTGKAGALIFQWAPFDYYGFDPIYRRAWTLEERILSPRVLCYTSSGIFWQCQSGHYLIGQGVRAPDGDVIIGGRPSYTERLENTFFQKEIESLPGKESLEVLLKLWSDLVHDYSARSVTDHKDRLRAISGLAARFQTLFSDTYTYKAGLWHGSSEGHVGKSLLLSQLLWRESSGPLRNPRDDKIPTWSWASAQNFINWDLLTGITAAPLRDVPGSVIDCTVHPLSLKNPFGQVDSGSVMLQGVLRTASIANPRLYLGNDTYLTTYLDPSNNASTRAAEGVSFLLLLHSHGLVLRKTDQGSMRRIGVFYIHWDTDWDTNRSTQDDLAYRKSRRNIRALVEPGVKAFFGEGTGSVVATVTII